MARHAPAEIEPVRITELFRVPIRGGQHKRHAVAFRDIGSAQRHPFGRYPELCSRRSAVPQQFFNRRWHKHGLRTQHLRVFGILQQREPGAREETRQRSAKARRRPERRSRRVDPKMFRQLPGSLFRPQLEEPPRRVRRPPQKRQRQGRLCVQDSLQGTQGDARLQSTTASPVRRPGPPAGLSGARAPCCAPAAPETPAAAASQQQLLEASARNLVCWAPLDSAPLRAPLAVSRGSRRAVRHIHVTGQDPRFNGRIEMRAARHRNIW